MVWLPLRVCLRSTLPPPAAVPPAKDENLDYALSYQNMDKFDKVTSIHDCLNRSIIVAFLQSTIFSHAFWSHASMAKIVH